MNRTDLKAFKPENLRKFRNEECLTQEFVAKQLGLGQSTYQKLETGEIKISTERLVQLSKLFNKPLEAFMVEVEHFQSETRKTINISKSEYDLMLKVIAEQEKRINELESVLLKKTNN